MYQIVRALNGFIREEIIPNPFEFISENPLIVMLFTYFIGGMILHRISLNMCGVFYSRGDAPVIGSIGYIIAFGVNVGILINLSEVFDSVLMIGIVYGFIVIGIFRVLYKIKDVMFIS